MEFSQGIQMDSLGAIKPSQDLNDLISRCVHCGFCNATCPTYLATGLELEGPRGRIALVRSMLDHPSVTEKTRSHFDHCLTCLACETTCPSGVEYRHIIDGGRQWLEATKPRSLISRLPRLVLTRAMNHPEWLSLAFKAGRRLRFLFPRSFAAYLKVPRQGMPSDAKAHGTGRKVLIIGGCVQRAVAPGIDDALATILARLAYQVIRITKADCCGALGYHLSEIQSAKAQARKTLNALAPYLNPAEEPHPFIIMSSSACGLMLKDYRTVLKGDTAWEQKAEQILPWLLDPLEILERHVEELKQIMTVLPPPGGPLRLHEPCTFQHGLRLRGRLAALFQALGFNLTEAPSSHICCGAGGIHPLLNPDTANTLRIQKRKALGLGTSETAIALTANIGCMLHLDETGDVHHWVEYLASRLK